MKNRNNGTLKSVIIGLTVVLGSAVYAATEQIQSGPDLVSKCIARTHVQSGSNYQILLKELYHTLSGRFDGVNVIQFDEMAMNWRWQKLSDTPEHYGYIDYIIQNKAYVPTPEFPHELRLKIFVNDKKIIMDVIPVLYVKVKKPYSQLSKIGYPKRSVLGRLIRLPDFQKKAKLSGEIESISVYYQKLGYLSHPSIAYGFGMDIDFLDDTKRRMETIYYEVVSGLDYNSRAVESPERYKSENTLVAPPFPWETLLEQDGSSVFAQP